MNSEVFKKFSPNLKRALVEAEKIALGYDSSIDTEHQLLSLLHDKETLAYEILTNFDISLDRIGLITSLITRKDHLNNQNITPDAKKSIQLAVQNALKFHHQNIGSEHMLLALVSNKSFNSYQVIERIGVDPKKIKKQIESIFQGISNSFNAEPRPIQNSMFDDTGFLPPEMGDGEQFFGIGPAPLSNQVKEPPKKDSVLDSFSTNLTKLANEGKLDPVIGREKEISRIIQTLSRRTKNNPILIGEPGVGKTAIVEGLAQRIAAGNISDKLRGTEILSIDLGSILAGTMYRGQFESRIKKILAEIKKNGNIILFVDEVHMMVGAGSTEGSIDAANLLKPMLARGELRLIGSTTFDEYKKHIEKDAAFERRFQPVKIDEPSIDETIKILSGIKNRYEKFHAVVYSESALRAAAELSARYINDRFLPDKAIDLIDEAGASKNTQIKRDPVLHQSERELAIVLKRKESMISAEKYEDATKMREREMILKEKISQLSTNKSDKDATLVTDEDIAKLVGDWTGVPVSNINASERKSYLNLDKKLRKKIIGQDEAIAELSKALKRSRIGIGNPRRPIGSFLFLGPTGVGKTELAKVLARDIFGSENSLVKLDMSEFMEKHNVARLIGAPAGYIGYEEGGKLTETIRKNPYSIILFDEIEKAHPEVFNILLQIMEDGELSDAKGRKVDFRNCILILTSNLGTDVLRRRSAIGFNNSSSSEEKYQLLKRSVMETVEKSFRPEFINRLDQIIVFYPLDGKSLRRIVDLQLEELRLRLKNQQYNLEVPSKVRDFIAKKSFNEQFGARPIRKYIADHIETLLSDAILSEQLLPGNTIKISLHDNNIVLAKPSKK